MSSDFPAHAKSVAEVLKHYGVDETQGLSTERAAQLVSEYGYNELEKEPATPLWKLVLEQFDDLLVKILLGAAMFSLALAMFDSQHGEGWSAYVEPFVILLILIANAVVGVWQETNAEKALEALKDLQSETARVIRDGKMQTLAARELVPGDVIEVRVGDKVPADARMIRLKTTTIRAEQSQLTGETVSVDKTTDPMPANTNIVQGKVNMLFGSTTIANGSAVAVVVATGMKSEIGKIHEAVQEAAKDEEDTPLQKKLDQFGETLSKVIGIICLLVWVINYRNFWDPAHGSVLRGAIYYFKIAVALAVAAIPEGLPAVITTCLALGTRKMAKKNAIVRKLPSVETLGCTTVICSDKTGTLTTNEMCAVEMVFFGKSSKELRVLEVEGHSFNPHGKVHGLQRVSEEDRAILDFERVCSLCNESSVDLQHGKYVRVGEPTEAALKVLVEKIGHPGKNTDDHMATNRYFEGQFEKLATLEFSRDRKSMSVLCRDKQSKKNVMFVKGAPESVIERSTHVRLNNGQLQEISKELRATLHDRVSAMAEKSLRCLALAVKEDTGVLADYSGPQHKSHQLLTDSGNFVKLEQGLILVGLVGMLDPPRPEVRHSIELCTQAGIRVIVITGDNQKTAESVARKIGVFTEDEDVHEKSFTGEVFMAFPESRQLAILGGHSSLVFSRTEPRHKQMLVKLLKSQNEIVAMTGDGVNDAPALKQADIGIAMGISGTEVAKEASDMVLADDNFSTIVSAVEEGRSIYNNMKAFIRYLISSNIGEVASIFLTAILGIPEGMAPVQLLWVNLVTDGPPATALGFNPPDVDVMKKPPRRTDDALINSWVFFRYMVIGVYVGVATVGIFVYWYLAYDWAQDGHSLITWDQLSNWSECAHWSDFKVNDFAGMSFAANPCKYFTEGKTKASTLSLSVLVVIEMLNALNALSEDGSLFHMPPWANPWLLVAIFVSMVLHMVILYLPFFNTIFSIVPLTYNDWMLVLVWSFPVIVIDEVLKFIGRHMNESALRKRLAAQRKRD